MYTPIPSNTRVLILADGGLASLICCIAAREAGLSAAGAGQGPGAPLVLPASTPGATALARRRSIDRACVLFGLEAVPEVMAAGARDRGVGALPGELETRDLINASLFALRLGAGVVVWPVQAGGDDVRVDHAAKALDRALLVSRLIGLDAAEHGQPGFRILTPLVDLTDRQVADLAVDMDAPADACWWWNEQRVAEVLRADAGAPAAPGADDEGDAELVRWTRALRDVGFFEDAASAAGA
jgi:hypothetical protein